MIEEKMIEVRQIICNQCGQTDSDLIERCSICAKLCCRGCGSVKDYSVGSRAFTLCKTCVRKYGIETLYSELKNRNEKYLAKSCKVFHSHIAELKKSAK